MSAYLKLCRDTIILSYPVLPLLCVPCDVMNELAERNAAQDERIAQLEGTVELQVRLRACIHRHFSHHMYYTIDY